MDKIKPSKSDSTWNLTTDFFKNGPEILFKHLEIMIRSFLVHGHVSQVFLLATLVPIVKDKLGDLCSSTNYRSIAISSVILKLIDWLIINIFGHHLKLDDFQFGFQENSSTSLCSWDHRSLHSQRFCCLWRPHGLHQSFRYCPTFETVPEVIGWRYATSGSQTSYIHLAETRSQCEMEDRHL